MSTSVKQVVYNVRSLSELESNLERNTKEDPSAG